jgi:maltose alpha-D-glucosyltransferase/alpha-amylase
MMEHEARKRMTLSLLFALPGAPLLVAGQEIGTGDDLSLEGRAAVRLPMQWSPEAGGGFSTSREGEAAHLVTEGPYGIGHVNVADQERDPRSLLHLVRALTRLWREHPGIASPQVERLDADPALVVFRYDDVVAVHNLAAAPRPLPDELRDAELLLGDETDADGMLPAYGIRWTRTA